MALLERSATSGTMVQQIQTVMHHSVFTRTIRRRLQLSGISEMHPLLHLPLFENPRIMRNHTWQSMFKRSSLPIRLKCFLDLLVIRSITNRERGVYACTTTGSGYTIRCYTKPT
ncbi:hypothetical protein TNCV_3624361 [Trichonephila clavipes]|nr:hypothetical protein TNCV_3624361 [Trichonephila clavipes]